MRLQPEQARCYYMEYRINQALIIQRGVPERNRQHFRILDPEAGDKLDDVGPCFGRVAEALKSWQQLGDHLGRVDVRLGADPESTLEEDVQPGRAPKSKQATQNISEPMPASTKMRLSFSPRGPSVSVFVPSCFTTRCARSMPTPPPSALVLFSSFLFFSFLLFQCQRTGACAGLLLGHIRPGQTRRPARQAS